MLSIDKVNKILGALLGSEALVNQWWSSPNKAFEMKKPRDVYIDDPDKVSKYVLAQIEAPH